MGKSVFMTGASGFLGRSLLENILRHDSESSVYVLHRSPASKKILKDKFKWVGPERLVYVMGDITKPNMGIEPGMREHLDNTVDEVWHNAASTSFDDSQKEEIEETNLYGTQHMLTLAEDFKNLEDFFYMSTAYVCGNEKGEIPEGPLTNGRGFKNVYEKSKFKCERMVRNSGLPHTILRPSIIIGDSSTGDPEGESRMVYGYQLAIYLASLRALGGENGFLNNWIKNHETSERFNIDARVYGFPDVTKNLVPINDVVDVCAAARHDPARKNATYNIVNPENITVGTMLEHIQRSLGVTGYHFDGELEWDDLDKSNFAEKAAFRYTKAFGPYVRYSEPVWHTDNVDSLGVTRVPMSSGLFGFYMDKFAEKEIVQKMQDG